MDLTIQSVVVDVVNSMFYGVHVRPKKNQRISQKIVYVNPSHSIYLYSIHIVLNMIYSMPSSYSFFFSFFYSNLTFSSACTLEGQQKAAQTQTSN